MPLGPWQVLSVFFSLSLFGQRTRRGRCPIGQRGEFSVRPYVRTNERANERPSGRPLRVQPPPDPSPSALSRPQPPRPLETLPRPQLPCSRPPATPLPLSPGPCLPLESPCPPRTDGKFTPLSYRTSSPSGPLPCLNFSILKRWPRASNSQQYPLPCCAHFRFPKCVRQGRGYR